MGRLTETLDRLTETLIPSDGPEKRFEWAKSPEGIVKTEGTEGIAVTMPPSNWQFEEERLTSREPVNALL